MGEDTEASIKLSGQLELLRKDIASRIEVMDIKVVNKLSSIDTHLGRLNSSVEKNNTRSLANKESIIKLQTDNMWSAKLDGIVHGNIKEKQSLADKRIEKLWDYIIKNSPTIGLGGGVVWMIGKMQGWW